jgi:hypothetical protein
MKPRTLPITPGQILEAKLIKPIVERIAERVAHAVLDRLDTQSISLQATRQASDSQKLDPNASNGKAGANVLQRGEIQRMSYVNVIGELPPPQDPPEAPRRRSQLCKQADFALDAYRYWSAAMRIKPTLHRKYWEMFYIAQALYERGLLEQGRSGLGFGVGREPLPAVFASRGCTIVATDQAPDDAVKGGWQQAGQHADGIVALERSAICPLTDFRERVTFEVVDMNHIPSHLTDRFDFCWSACSLDHLGSLQSGLRFVENSIGTLKAGGIAVHTTEFNLSSNADTVESPELSVYRKSDIETLFQTLEQAGHQVEPLDLSAGTTFLDGYVDLPPYRIEPHLRLRIAEYDCTSIGLIIARG